MKGFTLVEIIVVIAISSLLMVGLIRFMAGALPIYRSTFLQVLADETARVQLKRISHEIREVRPSDTGAYPIVEASAQKFVFYANIDSDVATERVRYELIGTNLVRGITKPSGNPLTYDVSQEVVSVIARSIQNGANPVFYYYGSNYPADQAQVPGSNIANITYMAFTLTIDQDVTQDPKAIVVQSQVQFRNLKTNL